MKVLVSAAVLASTASAFSPTFVSRAGSELRMSYDLDYGKKNSYVPASIGDGGQGQFGAVSPSDWRVPGTSPVGQSSYEGAADGGDEPWFAEAVSTVSLDLKKADETLKAFTKEAANFKIEAFAETNPYGFESTDAGLDELVGKMGYSKFLESSTKQIQKVWDGLHPDPAVLAAEKKKKEAAAKKKKEEAAAKK